MLTFPARPKSRIKTKEDAVEALRQLAEIEAHRTKVEEDRSALRKKVLDKVEPKLKEIDEAHDAELRVQIGGKPIDLSAYQFAIQTELQRWASEDLADKTFKTEYGTISTRVVAEKLDAAILKDEQADARKTLVEKWWDKMKSLASAWLSEHGLDPWFRLKMELNLDAVNTAYKAGKITLAQAREIGLKLVPESTAVTIKFS